MRIYEVRYDNRGAECSGIGAIWVRAKSEIPKAKRKIKSMEYEFLAVYEENIPMDKKGLLEWLNQNANVR